MGMCVSAVIAVAFFRRLTFVFSLSLQTPVIATPPFRLLALMVSRGSKMTPSTGLLLVHSRHSRRAAKT